MPSIPIQHTTPELEEIPEFSHLTTTSQPFLTGHSFALPYPTILREGVSTDRGLSPSLLGSPGTSPTPSFGSSLSPSSLYDSLLSDTDSLLSPSPDTPDGQFAWPPQRLDCQSSESLPSHPSFIPGDSFPHSDLSQSGTGPHRSRVHSSPSRHGPVASKAMIEANGRRRRHPAPFECSVCFQTFTAQFSLKREFRLELCDPSSIALPLRPYAIAFGRAPVCVQHPWLLSAILQQQRLQAS